MLSHYLSDAALPALFRELARGVPEHIVFPDAVECPSSWANRLLWRLDGGTLLRRAEVLLSAMEAQFMIEYVEEYRMFHLCVLCVARPRVGAEHAGEGMCDDAM